ncbi:Exonuclease mut-7-like [Symbiodinium microadriaticum]|uniref:Exonuclease mut-7-like n=1 Tax=Symbiodinium microadriaticum TaxID=2951 RepID=A0A1Q9F5Z5_SYMMI|nr:Exonuclease mut-7-like [Symbiodinium microadriaticum]
MVKCTAFVRYGLGHGRGRLQVICWLWLWSCMLCLILDVYKSRAFAVQHPLLEPPKIKDVAAAASDCNAQEFLARVRKIPLASRRSSMEVALNQSGLDEGRISLFLLSCLEVAAKDKAFGDEGKLTGMVCSLCSDGDGRPEEDPAVRQRALAVSLQLWRHNASQFTALRVLQQWCIDETDATGQQLEAIQRMSEDLLENNNWRLLQLFLKAFPRFAPEHADRIDEAIKKMCEEGSFKAAIQVAKCALWPSSRIGRLYRQLQFHQIKTGARSEQGKELASIAACGKDQGRQRLFVKELFKAGKLELASERISAWSLEGLRPTSLQKRKGAKRARNFYQLPAHLKVRTVSLKDEVEEGVSVLQRAQCIGFDTESLHGGRPCLLQVASNKHALLIDLLALQPDAAASVARLFSNSDIVKVSFAGRQDLRQLSTVLGVEAKSVTPCFDLKHLGALYRMNQSDIDFNEALDGLGLSSLAEEVLGKPLNKEMRASDWSRRPLLPAQQQYAAVDAWVLLRPPALSKDRRQERGRIGG